MRVCVPRQPWCLADHRGVAPWCVRVGWTIITPKAGSEVIPASRQAPIDRVQKLCNRTVWLSLTENMAVVVRTKVLKRLS
jgi:hypothetical protein